MHIIASLELLGTLIAVLEQKKANEEISNPFMLENFFLSERRLVNAIVRVMLELKMFISHEIKCYLQCRRQDFNM